MPRAEIEGEMGDSFVGIQARLMSQALRKLTGAVSRSNTSLVFTNQLREKIGVMFGNPETTPGGRALKFYASVRLDIRRIETIKTGTESVGNRVRVKVVKNKVAPPFRVAEFDVMYGEGISKEGGLLDVGVAMDVVNKTGAWFTFDETRLGQGREASKEFLKANPEIAAEIDRRIRGRIDEVQRPGRGHRRGRVTDRAADRRPGPSPAARVVRRAAGAPRRDRRSGGRPRGRAPLPRDAGTVGRRDAPSADRRRLPARARSTARSIGCSALGILDDEAFARQWVESRDRARPRGEIALKRELRLRGVDPAVIDDSARRARARARRTIGRWVDSARPTAPARSDPDEAAARRLLDRRRRDLDRVADPAQAPRPGLRAARPQRVRAGDRARLARRRVGRRRRRPGRRESEVG